MTSAISAAGMARFTVREDSYRGSGSLDASHGDLRASFSIGDGKTLIKAVILPGATYVRPGTLMQGKHWAKLGDNVTNVQLKTLKANVLGGAATASPLVQMKAGRSAGIFRVVATPQLDGVKTTEFFGLIPQAAYRNAYPPAAQTIMKLTHHSKLWFWLDSRDRPVKMESESYYSDGPSIDIETFNWGSAPPIEVPPSADTISVPS